MKRPNVLVFITDHHRWDAVGANGNPDVKTPNLDGLAEDGVSFDHCFVQSPVCMPSRVSLLTGQYPSTLGITHMGVPVPEGQITLPRLFGPYGYHTANIGKLHFLPHANRDHRVAHPDYGFHHLEISDEPGCYEDAYRAWVRRKAPDQLDLISVGLPPATKVWQRELEIDDGIVHPTERFPIKAQAFRGASGLTHTAFVAEQTIEYLRARRNETFLCVAGFYSPHSPWVAPQEFLDLYDPTTFTLPTFPPEVDARRPGTIFSDDGLRVARHGFYAMLSEVDHHVGRVLSELEALGLADDTIVVYTCDHGDWLGEHLLHGKGYPAPDAVSRVPLLVRWPRGLRQPGRRSSGIVELVDLIPTLLEAAGIQVPPHVQGESLLPALDATGVVDKGSALLEHAGWKSLRTARYHYVCESGRESLWDLDADPGEYVDVASDPTYAGALAEVRLELLQRLIRAERPLPRVWPY